MIAGLFNIITTVVLILIYFLCYKSQIIITNNTNNNNDFGSPITNVPSVSFHSINFIQDYLVLYGGLTLSKSNTKFFKLKDAQKQEAFNTQIYLLELISKKWFKPEVNNIPNAITFHKSVVKDNNLVVYNNYLNQFDVFNFDLLNWSFYTLPEIKESLIGSSFTSFQNSQYLLYGGLKSKANDVKFSTSAGN